MNCFTGRWEEVSFDMQVEDSFLSTPFYKDRQFWNRNKDLLQDIKLKNDIISNLPLILLLSNFNILLHSSHVLDILLK